jgi:hypothetical protein
MDTNSSRELETICDSIFSETSKDISWKWDERFHALLTEFICEDREEVISVLEKNFETCWNESNINDAPVPVKNVASQLGNIRQNQRLYSSDPSREVLVLGAYWPWNNGRKFSLRVLMDMLTIDLGSETLEEPMGPTANS